MPFLNMRNHRKLMVVDGSVAFIGGINIGLENCDRPSGKRRVQDGPFAEAKEQLGGFTILECPSLDAALEWAARCPAASYGSVEVRPVDVDLHDTICEA